VRPIAYADPLPRVGQALVCGERRAWHQPGALVGVRAERVARGVLIAMIAGASELVALIALFGANAGMIAAEPRRVRRADPAAALLVR
jgi:hypothetical protein